MKDLVEFLVRGLATYFPLLGAMLAAPKTTILQEVRGVEHPIPKAMTFIGLSIVFGFLLQAPFGGDATRLASAIASMVALYSLTLFLGAMVIMLSFRLVGGRATLELNLSAYLYLMGPLYLFLLITNFLSIGIIATHDPELARAMRLGMPLSEDALTEIWNANVGSAAAFAVVSLLQVAFLLIWPILCWGAFSELNAVSRARSVIAWVVAMLGFILVLTPMTLLMMRAMGEDGAFPPII
jgi:hypothetical protein